MPATALPTATTVNVEDDVHTPALAACMPRSRWSSRPSRIDRLDFSGAALQQRRSSLGATS